MNPAQGSAEVEHIRLVLRQAIVNGTVPGGTKLTESAVAAHFHTTRMPVRVVMRSLRREGLLDGSPQHMGKVHRPTRAEIADIAELHAMCDEYAVAQATLRRNFVDLDACQVAYSRVRTAVAAGDLRAAHDAGVTLRTLTYHATHHRALIDLHDLLQARTLQMFELSAYPAAQPLTYYGQILEAITSQDPELAASAMSALSTHLSEVRQLHASTLFDDEADAKDAHDDASPPTDEPFTPEWVLVHRELSRQIIENRRAPGSPLASRRIADEFGISRGPVVEALEVLSLEGLATARSSRKAARVRTHTPQELDDVWDLTQSLDLFAARLAAMRRSHQGAQALAGRLIDLLTTPRDQPPRSLDRALAFRHQMYEMAGNPLLVEANRLVEARFEIAARERDSGYPLLSGQRLLYQAIVDRSVSSSIEEEYRAALARSGRDSA